MYAGSVNVEFSTRDRNPVHFEHFKSKLKRNLSILNYQKRIKLIIDEVNDGFVKGKLKTNVNLIIEEVEKYINDLLELSLIASSKKELSHIEECLSGNSFFNLTGFIVPDKAIEYINKGGKYNPFFKKNTTEALINYDQEFCTIVNKLIKFIVPKSYYIKPKCIKRDVNLLCKFLNENQLNEANLQMKTLKKRFCIMRKRFVKSLNKEYNGAVDLSKQELHSLFDFNPDVMFLEGDKNVGFACIEKADVLEAYKKINIEQHFCPVNVNEADYIFNIRNYVKQARDNLPHELSAIIPKSTFAESKAKAEIGTLRLQPKILKLKSICKEQVVNLKCRGIKSSMSDPIRSVQSALDKTFSHILFYQEKYFVKNFGRNSPSVTGITESLERIKKSRTGVFGSSLEVQCDFENLYSNCDIHLLKEHDGNGLDLVKISTESKEYVFNLIDVEMEKSYFKEPSGIFN